MELDTLTKYSDNIDNKHKEYVRRLNDEIKWRDENVKRTRERGQMELEDLWERSRQAYDHYKQLEKKYEEKYEKCQRQKTKIKHLKDKLAISGD